MGRLDGKVAIITGGAGGIGRAAAELFLREGARVVLVDRNADAVGDVAATLGADCHGLGADVTRADSNGAMVKAALTVFGRLDILFANAGIEGTVAPLILQEEANFDRVLAVNLKGAWLGIKHAVPAMAGHSGSIVVTSSVAGLVGTPGLGFYVASKHAIMGLVKTAAIELAPLGIRVNTVNPGPVDNRMMRSIEDQASPGHGDEVKHTFVATIPMQRYARNEEIAAAVLFLASDESSVITGTSVVADGGLLTQ